MMVTLDLFTKKAKLYYVGLFITVITFSFITIASFYNLQFESAFMPLYNTLLIICSLASVAFILTAGTGLIRIYIKDGELILAEHYLIIDNVKISIGEINKISLNVSTRTEKSFILTGNKIEVEDNKGNSYTRRFAIKSYNQNQEFQNVLNSWNLQGVVYLYYKT